MNKRLFFIGAGPSNIFSILYLLENGIEGSSIFLIDKGASPYDRKKEDLLYGFGGAGLYSDCKLIFSNAEDTISHLIPNKEKYFEIIKGIVEHFHPRPNLINISTPKEYISKSELQLIQSECWHVGSDYGLILNQNIYTYLISQGVNLILNTEVLDIDLDEKRIRVNKYIYNYDFLQIGTGKIGGKQLLSNLYQKYDIKIKKGAIHFGGRFETEITPEIENIIDNIQYDFKFFKRYNENLSIRTFCCNTRNAYVVKEITPNGVQFNGHAFRNSNFNNLCNFGIIMEIKGDEWTEEKLLFGLSKGICWDEELIFKSSLEEKFDNKLYISTSLYNFREELNNFLNELNKELGFGKNYRIYFPEIKQSIGIIETDEYFRLKDERYNEVAWVGDSCCGTRGIIPSTITGLKAVEKFIL